MPQSLEQGPGLKLEAVSIGDSGTYACMAASEAGEARRRFQLTVMGGCLVLSSCSGWRVRGDPRANRKGVAKMNSLEAWGISLCEAPEACLALTTKIPWLRSTVFLSSIPTFLYHQTLVSKAKARATSV